LALVLLQAGASTPRCAANLATLCFSQSANKQMVKYLRANHFAELKTIKLRQRLRPCLFSASFQTMVSDSFLLIIFANTTRIKHTEMIQNRNFFLANCTGKTKQTKIQRSEWFLLMTMSTKVNFCANRKCEAIFIREMEYFLVVPGSQPIEKKLGTTTKSVYKKASFPKTITHKKRMNHETVYNSLN
jgi:hypothetical protein